MIIYESSVLIRRPAEDIFPYLVDPALQGTWSDVPMRQITGGTWRAGTQAEVTFGMGPLNARLTLEVKALDPARRMAFATVGKGPIEWSGEYVLRATADGGTEMSQKGTLRFRGLWRLLEPIVGAEMRSGEIKELERLKAVVEKPQP